MFPGQGTRFEKPGKIPLIDNISTPTSGKRAYIDNMVRHLYYIRVMLYYKHGISFVPEFYQEFIQAVHVPRVQTYTRLVEDVHHVHQATAKVFYHFNALRFATRQRAGFAVETKVFKTDINEILQSLR